MRSRTRVSATLVVFALSAFALLGFTWPAAGQEEQVEATVKAFTDAVFEGNTEEAGRKLPGAAGFSPKTWATCHSDTTPPLYWLER